MKNPSERPSQLPGSRAGLALTHILRFSVIFVILLLALPGAASLALAVELKTNQVPNSEFRGTDGNIQGFNSVGVPSTWRMFEVGAADAEVTVVPVSANELYPGSPATNAARLEVLTFGDDQGFDHENTMFALTSAQPYRASFYVKTANADDTSQQGQMGLPIFDLDRVFTGLAPGSAGFTATSGWQLIEGPVFTSGEDTLAYIAFRMVNDGGTQDAILIAMPEVVGPPIGNEVPNPVFAGSGGLIQGNVTGTIPDFWRGFAVNTGVATITPVPLAADALYPGSLPTNAIQLTINTFGDDQGFDHEVFRFPIAHGHSYWTELYMKSADSSGTPQTVTIAVPVFDDQGAFTGRQPGSFVRTAGAEWSLFGSVSFVEEAGTTANISFRLTDNGADNSILIALPSVGGPPPVLIHEDGFEDPD